MRLRLIFLQLFVFGVASNTYLLSERSSVSLQYHESITEEERASPKFKKSYYHFNLINWPKSQEYIIDLKPEVEGTQENIIFQLGNDTPEFVGLTNRSILIFTQDVFEYMQIEFNILIINVKVMQEADPTAHGHSLLIISFPIKSSHLYQDTTERPTTTTCPTSEPPTTTTEPPEPASTTTETPEPTPSETTTTNSPTTETTASTSTGPTENFHPCEPCPEHTGLVVAVGVTSIICGTLIIAVGYLGWLLQRSRQDAMAIQSSNSSSINLTSASKSDKNFHKPGANFQFKDLPRLSYEVDL